MKFSYYKYFWKVMFNGQVSQFGGACWMSQGPLNTEHACKWLQSNILKNTSGEVYIDEVREITLADYLNYCKKELKGSYLD